MEVQQAVVTCSCASCGFAVCTVFYLYPLVFYVPAVVYSLVHRFNQELRHSLRDCKSQGCSGI